MRYLRRHDEGISATTHQEPRPAPSVDRMDYAGGGYEWCQIGVGMLPGVGARPRRV